VKQRDEHLQFLLDDSVIFTCVTIYYINQVHIHFLYNYEIQMSVIDNPQLYLSILLLKTLLLLKYRTEIKCISFIFVNLDSLSCSFTSTSFFYKYNKVNILNNIIIPHEGFVLLSKLMYYVSRFNNNTIYKLFDFTLQTARFVITVRIMVVDSVE
jgi:hypothetical protein